MSAPRRRLDDDELGFQLQRRAARARLAPGDRERLVAAATAAQAVRPAGTRWNILSAPIAAALVVALVVGVTILGSIPSGPAAPTGGSIPVAGSASAPPPASAAPRPEEIQVLTPAEVEALLTRRPERRMEQVVVADVIIDVGTESLSPCDRSGVCPVGMLRLPGGPVPIYAPEDVRVGLALGELRGSLAISLASMGGIGPSALLGVVEPGALDLSTVPEVLARAEEIEVGDLLVVEGWLVAGGDGTIRCGRPDDDPFDGPFRCEPTNWIAESPDEPVMAVDGSGWLRMPGPALAVQPYAAGRFARFDPDADGPPQPRREAFLVQAKEDVSIDCGGCQQWQILGRIDPVGPPELVEAPEPGPTLAPMFERAWSAVPDANVPLPQALSLVATASKWLIPWDIENGTSWADRPLAPSRVDVTVDRAVIEFHDYDHGGKVLVEFLMRDGEPVSIEAATRSGDRDATLSAWEQEEARRLAVDGTRAGSFGGTVARDVRAGHCSIGPGRCAIVELVDEFADPPLHVADVIVDIGRAQVVRQFPVPASPSPP
ncbi:MAG: hypothetical protein M3395_01890 [Chloroflexota bacterium]|nr:hypothetical protein [Chloroflexota bacterium]